MDHTKCTLYSSGLKGAEETFGDLRSQATDATTPAIVTQDAPRLRVVNRPTEQDVKELLTPLEISWQGRTAEKA